MTLQTNPEPKNDTVQIDHRELLFFKRNAPNKGFASLVAEMLEKDGIQISRVRVHQELTTIKDRYNRSVIEKAREVLKGLTGEEYDPEK